MNKFYRISACTPEEGRIQIDTMDEAMARRVHSNLMQRQLNPNDFTHDVTVRYMSVSDLEAEASDYGVGKWGTI